MQRDQGYFSLLDVMYNEQNRTFECQLPILEALLKRCPKVKVRLFYFEV